MYELSHQFYFDAAHTLDREIEADSSRQIHGHTYNAEIAVRGLPNPLTGMIIDTGLLRSEIERVRKLLDHRFLDDVIDLGAPTLENLCAFIERTFRSNGLVLSRVTIWRQGNGDRCSLFVAE